jgi:DNA-binding GntR family transcriptional regulator
MPYTKKQHVIDDITAKIRSGEHPPRSRLPSGTQMQKIYNCSGITIRAATDYLKYAGWIVSVPGAGFFVVDKPPV